MKFTEEQLENAIIALLGDVKYPHVHGGTLARQPDDVLIEADLREYLTTRYAEEDITDNEIRLIIKQLESSPASDLYDSNKAIMKLVSEGFLLKREDRNQKDLLIELIDYSEADNNLYKVVNQLEIVGYEKRIPDLVLYINGLPLVLFEFKSTIREEATIFTAYTQITTRYRRDIPELLKYNAFCVLSDGVNSKMGSLFSPYEYFYAWRKISGNETVGQDGINSLYTMIQGLFNKHRLRDVVRNFVYFPDTSTKEEKIVCRYPQYYAANKLFQNILL